MTSCLFLGANQVGYWMVLDIRDKLEELIVENGVSIFYSTMATDFDFLCMEFLTELKKKYPHTLRGYVQSEFPIQHDYYYFDFNVYTDCNDDMSDVSSLVKSYIVVLQKCKYVFSGVPINFYENYTNFCDEVALLNLAEFRGKEIIDVFRLCK